MFDSLLSLTRRLSRRRRPARQSSAPETLRLPDEDLEFQFQRDNCRTLRLTVKPDGSLRVTAPASMPMEAVLNFLRTRLAWIRAKQDFFLQHRGESTSFQNGGVAYFLGRPFFLRVIPARRGAKARLVGGVDGPFLELPSRSDSPADVEAAFKAWRMSLAKLILSRRLMRMDRFACARLNDDAHHSGLTIRSLKRRWGSCSVRGQITLAAQLIELPLPLIDYVLCHELCHLRRMDHSTAFRAALLRILPDAREREQQIRLWSLEHPRT